MTLDRHQGPSSSVVTTSAPKKRGWFSLSVYGCEEAVLNICAEGSSAQYYVFPDLYRSLAHQIGRLLKYLLIDYAYEANGMCIYLRFSIRLHSVLYWPQACHPDLVLKSKTNPHFSADVVEATVCRLCNYLAEDAI